MGYWEYISLLKDIMKNSRDYFKKKRLRFGLILSFLFLLFPFHSNAGSIKEVSPSVERVQSMVPSFRVALIGDSRDGEKVYPRPLANILERKPDIIIPLGDKISRPSGKEWQHFFDLSRPITVPCFHMISGGGGACIRFERIEGIFIQTDRVEGEVRDRLVIK